MTVANTSPPVVSGTPRQGSVLTTTNGVWTYDLDYLDYDYRWLRCDSAGNNCVAISGATNSSYLLTGADIGARLRSEVTATELATPPPPPSGTTHDSFSDFTPPWADMFFLKRWQNTNWVPLNYTGSAWSDGSGIFEVSTIHGAGFRFKQGSVVSRSSGGGVQMASYMGGQSFGQRVISGKLMFPSSGNTGGTGGFPPYGDWNVLMEFVDGSHTVRNQFGVDAIVAGGPKLYVRTYGGPGYSGHENNKKAHAPTQLAFDTWIDFEWELNLSKNSDGYARFSVDGTEILNHSGATLSSDYNSKIWNQWGWYGGNNPQNNEVYYAALSIT